MSFCHESIAEEKKIGPNVLKKNMLGSRATKADVNALLLGFVLGSANEVGSPAMPADKSVLVSFLGGCQEPPGNGATESPDNEPKGLAALWVPVPELVHQLVDEVIFSYFIIRFTPGWAVSMGMECRLSHIATGARIYQRIHRCEIRGARRVIHRLWSIFTYVNVGIVICLLYVCIL
jgi:hypothetical protein